MNKICAAIKQSLFLHKAGLEIARMDDNKEKTAEILAEIRGFKAGLKLCLKEELVDAIFEKEGV